MLSNQGFRKREIEGGYTAFIARFMGGGGIGETGGGVDLYNYTYIHYI